MQFIAQLLYVAGYILFVGPPHAIDLQRREEERGGELSGLPVWLVLMIEGLVRVGLLLVVGVLLEQALGYYWYSQLRIDFAMVALLIVGALHMVIYYCLFVLLMPRWGNTAARLYRWLRNFLYAALPGLPVIMVMYLWEGVNPATFFTEREFLFAYFITVTPFVFAGIFEALVVKRKPLGLDANIEI